MFPRALAGGQVFELPVHGEVGGEPGAGGDHDEGLVGGDGVEGELALDAGVHEQVIAGVEVEEGGGELAVVDLDDEELDVVFGAGGGSDGVGPADELGTFGGVAVGGVCGELGGEAEGGVLAGGEVGDGVVFVGHADDSEAGGEVVARSDGGVLRVSGHAGARGGAVKVA